MACYSRDGPSDVRVDLSSREGCRSAGAPYGALSPMPCSTQQSLRGSTPKAHATGCIAEPEIRIEA